MSNKLNENVIFRLEPERKKELEKKAKNFGITVSELLRSVAIYGGYVKVDYSSLNLLSTELSRIGNNVNQIARGINIKNRMGEKISLEEISQFNNEVSYLNSQLENIEKTITKMYKDSTHIRYINLNDEDRTET